MLLWCPASISISSVTSHWRPRGMDGDFPGPKGLRERLMRGFAERVFGRFQKLEPQIEAAPAPAFRPPGFRGVAPPLQGYPVETLQQTERRTLYDDLRAKVRGERVGLESPWPRITTAGAKRRSPLLRRMTRSDPSLLRCAACSMTISKPKCREKALLMRACSSTISIASVIDLCRSTQGRRIGKPHLSRSGRCPYSALSALLRVRRSAMSATVVSE